MQAKLAKVVTTAIDFAEVAKDMLVKKCPSLQADVEEQALFENFIACMKPCSVTSVAPMPILGKS